jgi:hypothetical protein
MMTIIWIYNSWMRPKGRGNLVIFSAGQVTKSAWTLNDGDCGYFGNTLKAGYMAFNYSTAKLKLPRPTKEEKILNIL